jgi:serine protease inhibitor
VLAGVVTLANAQGSVTGQPGHLLAAEPGKASVDYAVAADAGFAVDLYRQLCKENPGKNLFFSPYSMSSALAMAAEGARGETAAEMGRVLCFPDAARRAGDDAQLSPWNAALIHTGMAALNKRFNAPKPASKAIRGKIDSQYELLVANALWAEKTYPFQPSYLETIRKYYAQGGAFPADFRNQPEPTRLRINAWVEEQTRQRIKDLLPPGSVDPLTPLVLTNAIYFKGEWAEVFQKGQTQEDDFLLADGGKARVPMMRHDGLGSASYAAFNGDGTFFDTPREIETGKSPELYPDGHGFTMLEIPYKGDDLSMVAIVPQAADGLTALESSLTSASIQSWVGKLQKRAVNVFLPKFKLKTAYTLNDTLKAMGMVRAFVNPAAGPNGADFDGMCAIQNPALDQKLYIGLVVHKAFVAVDEKGTEAAAATAGPMRPGAMRRPHMVPFTPTFRADKPFVFLIRDRHTGCILFLGRMVSPKE